MERASKDEEGEGGKVDKKKPQTGLLKLRLAILVGLIHHGNYMQGLYPPPPRLANIMPA